MLFTEQRTSIFHVIHITHIHCQCVKDRFKRLPLSNNDKTSFWKEVIFPVRKIKINLHHWKVQGFFCKITLKKFFSLFLTYEGYTVTLTKSYIDRKASTS